MLKKLKNKDMIEKTIKNRKVGRPKKLDSEKVIYQKVPLRYSTYKKFKERSSFKNFTYSDYIEYLFSLEDSLSKRLKK